MTEPVGNRDRGLTLAILGALALVYLAHALYLSGLAEDAFIGFRFARHLAEGKGLVWNPGEAPVEGYTNFLWVVLCAGFIAAGRDVTVWAPAAGIVAGLLTGVYTWRFARRVFSGGVWSAALPCALLAVSGPMAVWASSGMETMLFAWLVTAACYHAAVYGAERRGRDAGAAAAFLVAATLARPEGLIIAAVLAVLGARYRGRVVPALLLFAVPVAVYVAWRVAYFGDWLPNTYYVKVAGGPLRLLRGAIYTGAFAVTFGVPLLPLLWRGRPLRRPRHPGTIVCLFVAATYTLYIVWAGGDYMAMYRFFAPVVPLVYLLAGRALTATPRRGSLATASAVTFALVATGVHSTPLDRMLFPKPPRQHGHYGGVETERWHVARLTVIGRYFASLHASPDESLATDAIGAISYYSGMRVYGMHGLVDRRLARAPGSGAAGLGLPGHETGDLGYILSRRPTYVMLSRLFTGRAAGYPDGLDPEVDAVLRREYEPVSVPLVDAVNAERGYFTYYARRSK